MFKPKRANLQPLVAVLDEYFADFETAVVCCLHGLRALPATDGLQKLYSSFVRAGRPEHLYPVVSAHWQVLQSLQQVHQARNTGERVRLRVGLEALRTAHYEAVEVLRAALERELAQEPAMRKSRTPAASGAARLRSLGAHLVRWREWLPHWARTP